MDKTIVWLMCRCYVWPTYRWSVDPGSKYQGTCGRCGEGARLLWSQDREDAVATFEANYRETIVPI